MEQERPTEVELQEIERDPARAPGQAVRLLASEVRRMRARERSWRDALALALQHGDTDNLYLAVRAIVAGEDEGPARVTQPIPEHD